MAKQICPTQCLGTWNKLTLESREWNRNLTDNMAGGQGAALPWHPVVGDLTSQIDWTCMKMA